MEKRFKKINDRFMEAVKFQGLTTYSLAKLLNKSTSQIYAIRDHKNILSMVILTDFLAKYPLASSQEIITGTSETETLREILLADLTEERSKTAQKISELLEKLKKTEEELNRKNKIIDAIIETKKSS